MSTVNKISSMTAQAVQRYADARMTANGVGSVSGSNPGNGLGSPTDNPFPSVYYYRGYTGYRSGAEELSNASGVHAFPEQAFPIDPSMVAPSDLTFQSEKIKNVNQYEINQAVTDEDNSSMEGDV